MKQRLIDLLACPECTSVSLQLEAFRNDGEEVMDGFLRCRGCSRQYPVISGVPRMLPDALRSSLRGYHARFFQEHDIPLGGVPVIDGVVRTLEFFTRQRVELFEEEVGGETWRRFEQTLNLRIPAARLFAGQVGLDAGCGEGRYIYTLSKYGAEVVGMDLGNAVDWAYRRAGSQPNVHVVQGSIFQPPFRESVFQFVMSIGVIHHLTEPRRGFHALTPLLRPGGAIHIWVYGLQNMSLVYRASHLRPFRRFTAKLSPKQSYALAIPIALALEGLVFAPTRALSHSSLVRAHIHPQLLDVSALRFTHKVAEVHDRIGAPVTHFLTGDQVAEWFDSAGLTGVVVDSTSDARGWSAYGTMPSSGASAGSPHAPTAS
jgi:uncharacterized protein YbaR (Trm112 family)/2-polyprenyl-3-methyl-5-hydroxy-6-metoxy-1,4-benzoquinol methylase